MLSFCLDTVCELFSHGNAAKAVIVLSEVLESFAYHFVEDIHYGYFDDMYSLDHVCQDMMEAITNAVKSEKLPDEEMQRLIEGMEKLKQTETYEDYGVLYALYVWEKFRKTNIE